MLKLSWQHYVYYGQYNKRSTTVIHENGLPTYRCWISFVSFSPTKVVACCTPSLQPQSFESGHPRNPTFPWYELFSNVSNCFPLGMHPTRLLWQIFKTSSDVRDVSFCGISPLILLDERSNDSSTDNWWSDIGISPSKQLWDKFNVRSPIRSPIAWDMTFKSIFWEIDNYFCSQNLRKFKLQSLCCHY